MNINDEHTLWVEKYRPNTVEECILPESIKNTFQDFVNRKDIPTLLLSGTSGTGKTTIAKALCNEIGAEYLFLNGSNEGRSIDVLRVDILDFASSVSLYDQQKVIIIDEADAMNPHSVQPALRSVIEEFSSNCRFVFTCNYKNRIIDPLLSRCTVIDFKLSAKDKQQMAGQFMKRAIAILQNENVAYESKVVAEVINKFFPDYRKIMMELQRYSSSGKIDSGILVNFSEESYKELCGYLKDKDWKNTRMWVGRNSDIDITTLFGQLYDNAVDLVEPTSIPQLVLTLGEYEYRSAFSALKEIQIMCAMTELMNMCKFK